MISVLVIYAFGDKNESSALFCVDEFCKEMKIASELMTNIQRAINQSGVSISQYTAFLVTCCALAGR